MPLGNQIFGLGGLGSVIAIGNSDQLIILLENVKISIAWFLITDLLTEVEDAFVRQISMCFQSSPFYLC